MKKWPLLLAVASILSACVTPNAMLVNPSTGEIRNCSASGWGWAGAPLAEASFHSCVNGLKSIGYIPMDEVTPATLEVDSDPPGAKIFAGPQEDRLEYIGTTPYRMVHPNGSRMWSRECYQVKKEGYTDSEITCRNKHWGDREISFHLQQS